MHSDFFMVPFVGPDVLPVIAVGNEPVEITTLSVDWAKVAIIAITVQVVAGESGDDAYPFLRWLRRAGKAEGDFLGDQSTTGWYDGRDFSVERNKIRYLGCPLTLKNGDQAVIQVKYNGQQNIFLAVGAACRMVG